VLARVSIAIMLARRTSHLKQTYVWKHNTTNRTYVACGNVGDWVQDMVWLRPCTTEKDGYATGCRKACKVFWEYVPRGLCISC
jgi:hypothetical protein